MEEVLRFGCGKVVVKCLVVYDDEVISVYYDYKIRVWCCLKNDFKQYKLVIMLLFVKDYMMNFLFLKNYVQVGLVFFVVILRLFVCNQFIVEFKIMVLNWNLNFSMI